jgi:hypothetical protein
MTVSRPLVRMSLVHMQLTCMPCLPDLTWVQGQSGVPDVGEQEGSNTTECAAAGKCILMAPVALSLQFLRLAEVGQ